MEFVDYNGNDITDIIIQPNDNLLFNSDWKNGIINQLGKSVYNNTTIESLSIDGWKYTNIEVTVNTNSIKLYANQNAGSFKQKYIKNLDVNSYYTVYIHINSLSGTAKIAGQQLKVGDNIITFLTTDPNSSMYMEIQLNNKTILVIDQMKLEKGKEYTGMPVYDYTNEFDKCRLYLRKINKFFLECYSWGGESSVYIKIDMDGMIGTPYIINETEFRNIVAVINGKVVHINNMGLGEINIISTGEYIRITNAFPNNNYSSFTAFISSSDSINDIFISTY